MGTSAPVTAGDTSGLISFPSFPCFTPFGLLWGCFGGGVCTSFTESYVPRINIKSGNKKKTEDSTQLHSPSRSQKARERLWVPNPYLCQLLKWPKLCLSISDLFSPREFPSGEGGNSRCVAACHRTPAPSFVTASHLHLSHSTVHTFWVSPTPAQTAP